jgi:hypothetical protein
MEASRSDDLDDRLNVPSPVLRRLAACWYPDVLTETNSSKRESLDLAACRCLVQIFLLRTAAACRFCAWLSLLAAFRSHMRRAPRSRGIDQACVRPSLDTAAVAMDAFLARVAAARSTGNAGSASCMHGKTVAVVHATHVADR